MGGKVYTGRALIKFDCTPINDVAVESAILYIYPYDCFDIDAMWDYNMRNGPKKIYRVTSAWTENNANWKNPWNVEGGDFDEANPLSSSSQKDTTVGEWESFDVTEVVKEHVQNPSQNFGFLIKFDDNDRRGIMVYSAQNEKIDMRPKLVINGDNTDIEKLNSQDYNRIFITGCNGTYWLHVPDVKGSVMYIHSPSGRQLAVIPIENGVERYLMPQLSAQGIHIISIWNKGNVITRAVHSIR